MWLRIFAFGSAGHALRELLNVPTRYNANVPHGISSESSCFISEKSC